MAPKSGQKFEATLPENPKVLNDLEKRAIKELREPISKLIYDMHEEIEKGEYSAIVIDQVSGQIPGLIVSEVFWRLYQEKGIIRPEVHFIQGSSPHRDGWKFDEDKKLEEMTNYFSKVRKRLTSSARGLGKVLYVSEFIESGLNAILFLRALQKKWPATVISVGVAERQAELARERIAHAWSLGTPFFYGKIGSPLVALTRDMTGLTKANEGDLHAASRIFIAQQVQAETFQKELQGKVLEAYALASGVAAEIVEEYRKKYQ